MSRLGKSLLVASALLAGVLAGTAVSGATDPLPTFGTIPQFEAGPSLDLSLIPDYVAVEGPNGQVAGYVRKEELFASGPLPSSPDELTAVPGESHLIFAENEPLTVYDAGAKPIGLWFHSTPGDRGGFRAFADNS